MGLAHVRAGFPCSFVVDESSGANSCGRSVASGMVTDVDVVLVEPHAMDVGETRFVQGMVSSRTTWYKSD